MDCFIVASENINYFMFIIKKVLAHPLKCDNIFLNLNFLLDKKILREKKNAIYRNRRENSKEYFPPIFLFEPLTKI